MDKFDTIQGKLFYTLYLMHQQKQIDSEQKGKLKDLIIQRHPSVSQIKTENAHVTRHSLLDLAYQHRSEQKTLNRQVNVRPITTNFKYRTARSSTTLPSPI